MVSAWCPSYQFCAQICCCTCVCVRVYVVCCSPAAHLCYVLHHLRVRKYALPLVIGVFIAMIWMNIDEHSYHKARIQDSWTQRF